MREPSIVCRTTAVTSSLQFGIDFEFAHNCHWSDFLGLFVFPWVFCSTDLCTQLFPHFMYSRCCKFSFSKPVLQASMKSICLKVEIVSTSGIFSDLKFGPAATGIMGTVAVCFWVSCHLVASRRYLDWGHSNCFEMFFLISKFSPKIKFKKSYGHKSFIMLCLCSPTVMIAFFFKFPLFARVSRESLSFNFCSRLHAWRVQGGCFIHNNPGSVVVDVSPSLYATYTLLFLCHKRGSPVRRCVTQIWADNLK